jgi:hypothetical protein
VFYSQHTLFPTSKPRGAARAEKGGLPRGNPKIVRERSLVFLVLEEGHAGRGERVAARESLPGGNTVPCFKRLCLCGL